MTSGTGLTLMPNANVGLTQLTTGKNAVAGLTFSWDSGIPALTNDFSTSQRKFITISSRMWMCSARSTGYTRRHSVIPVPV
jgi:hypothetical protein